jgi:hypothetical protein
VWLARIAHAYLVKDEVEAAGGELRDEYKGHPRVSASLMTDSYVALTF